MWHSSYLHLYSCIFLISCMLHTSLQCLYFSNAFCCKYFAHLPSVVVFCILHILFCISTQHVHNTLTFWVKLFNTPIYTVGLNVNKEKTCRLSMMENLLMTFSDVCSVVRFSCPPVQRLSWVPLFPVVPTLCWIQDPVLALWERSSRRFLSSNRVLAKKPSRLSVSLLPERPAQSPKGKGPQRS